MPQGTVLGPLLFLAFINDLPDVTKFSDTRLFADDSLLYREITSNHDNVLLQRDLTALEEWEKAWQMSFNATKCSVLHICPGNKKKLINTSYQLHGHTLDTEDASKYLGVTLTDDLSWGRHVSNTVGKGNRSLGFLRRNFKDCTTSVKAYTYTTMVRPAIEYASTVWDPHRQGDIKALEQVQRRAARYVFNNYTDRTPGCVTSMLQKLQWESLESRRYKNRLTMLYKINHGLVDVNTNCLKRSDCRTRGQQRFFQERISCEAYANSFFPRTIGNWNQLPSSISSSVSINEFRAGLSTRLAPAPSHQ